MYTKLTRVLAIVVFAFSFFATYAANTATSTMQKMVKRLFPDHATSFVFYQNSSDSDYFVLKSVDRKIVISGNSANSMAVGLNYYLKNYCLTTVSWYKNDPIEMPKTLPLVTATVKVKAKLKMRFFLNYCTYGYTMPWWNWKDWERFIDWMALNGVNMPLAITGQEAIWYDVWKKFGLTDGEIRSYFTGPAHLPWHRMCNVDGWQGPLPVSWLNGQKEMQKKIVQRERELNMKPILPGFAGHIPAALKRIYPNMHTTRVSEWGGFADQYRCTFLSPADSMFSVIQKAFLQEQTKIYGTDHIYGVDPFNEVDPPTWKEDSLANISKHIYQSLTAVDKDAVWLQMGWFFSYNSKNWTFPRMKALLQGTPQDKMVLLDYFCENDAMWQHTDSFFGQPFIWCYLGNFGGNTMVCAPLKNLGKLIDKAYTSAGKSFQGIGATLEGFGVNQFAYEYVMDKAWNIPLTDAQWLDNLADRRVGKHSVAERAIWKEMYDNVFVKNSTANSGTLIENKPELMTSDRLLKKKMYSDQQYLLLGVWRKMLSVNENTNKDTYVFDIVNIGRQVLGGYFLKLRNEFNAAYEAADIKKLKTLGVEMEQVLNDDDALLACHPTFSLKNWIDEARAMGKNNVEKDYYEKNARTLITVWGDKGLNDYARRGWSGLVASFYAPRWKMFIDMVIAASEQHKLFNEEEFLQKCHDFDYHYIEPSYKIVYPKEGGNAVQLSKQLLQKYGDKF